MGDPSPCPRLGAPSPDRSPTNPWNSYVLSLLKRTPNLTNLTLTLNTNHIVSKPDMDIFFTTLFTKISFATLTSFTLSIQRDPDHRGEPYPCNSIVDCGIALQNFLQIHASTLQNVTFHKIFFTSLHGLLNMEATLREILSLFREEDAPLNHLRLQWIVPRFEHHWTCKRAARGDGIGSCRRECGIYNTHRPEPGVNLIRVEMFDVLAMENGVGLDQESGTWDFGSTVGRRMRVGDSV